MNFRGPQAYSNLPEVRLILSPTPTALVGSAAPGSKVAIQMLKTNRLLTDFHEFSRAAGLLELTGGEADSVTDANGARRIGRAIK